MWNPSQVRKTLCLCAGIAFGVYAVQMLKQGIEAEGKIAISIAQILSGNVEGANAGIFVLFFAAVLVFLGVIERGTKPTTESASDGLNATISARPAESVRFIQRYRAWSKTKQKIVIVIFSWLISPVLFYSAILLHKAPVSFLNVCWFIANYGLLTAFFITGFMLPFIMLFDWITD